MNENLCETTDLRLRRAILVMDEELRVIRSDGESDGIINLFTDRSKGAKAEVRLPAAVRSALLADLADGGTDYVRVWGPTVWAEQFPDEKDLWVRSCVGDYRGEGCCYLEICSPSYEFMNTSSSRAVVQAMSDLTLGWETMGSASAYATIAADRFQSLTGYDGAWVARYDGFAAKRSCSAVILAGASGGPLYRAIPIGETVEIPAHLFRRRSPCLQIVADAIGERSLIGAEAGYDRADAFTFRRARGGDGTSDGDADVPGKFRDWLGRLEALSCLLITIEHQGRPWGVLIGCHRRPCLSSREVTTLGTTLARLMGVCPHFEISPARNRSGEQPAFAEAGGGGGGTESAELRMVRRALKRSDDFLRAIGKIAKVGGWDFDLKTRVIRWTEQTYHIHEVPFGAEPDISKSLAFYAPEHRSRVEFLMHRAAVEGVSFDEDFRFITARGNFRWVRVLCVPECEQGEVVRLMGTFQDITERKHAEQSLLESETRLRTLGDNLPDGAIFLYETDAEDRRRILYCSRGMERILGFTIPQILENADIALSRAHPDDLEYLANAERESRENLTAFDVEFRNLREPNAIQWLHCRSSPRRHADGVVVWDGILLDVTARKQAAEALKESQLRIQTIGDNLPQGGLYQYKVDPDGVHLFTYISKGVRSIVGLPAGNTMDLDVKEFISRNTIGLSVGEVGSVGPAGRTVFEEFAELNRSIEVSRRDLTTWEKEFRIRTPAGEWKWIQCRAFPKRLADGSTIWDGVLLEATERKQAESALRESEERLRLALEGGRLGIWDFNIRTQEVVWSKSNYEIFGYPNDDFFVVEQRHFWDRIHPDDREALENALGNAIAKGMPFSQEYRVIWPDGTIRRLSGTGQIQNDGNFGPARLVGVTQDITDRKNAEQRMREAWNLFSAGPAVLVRWGTQYPYPILAVSESINQFGYDSEDFLSQRVGWLDLVCSDDLHDMVGQRAGVRKSKSHAQEQHYRIVTPEGETRWVYDFTVAVTDDHGKLAYFDGYLLDITQLKRTEDALRTANAHYEMLANYIEDVVCLYGTDRKILFASLSSSRIFGFAPEELIGKDFSPYVYPEDLELVGRAWEANLRGEQTQAEWRFLTNKGTLIWCETTGIPVTDASGRVTKVIGSTREITRRKNIEDQLVRAQKLEAIGHLAGGVAHDFNNMLTVVIGCSELLLNGKLVDPSARSLLEEILKAGNHGTSLTRQLLAFSRQQIFQSKVFCPNTVIRDTMKLLSRLVGENIEILNNFDEKVGLMKGDIGQVEQVIFNLVVNARDAIPNGGQILIATARTVIREKAAELIPEARAGTYVRITVKDNGVGMSVEDQARLFEPFFTTKPVGQGTGLGLATVYGIVRQSLGFITVKSALNQGTEFHVHFPAHEPSVASSASTSEAGAFPAADELKAAAVLGGETILVVEDEDSLRQMMTAMLKQLGYRVISTRNGAEAIAACAKLPNPPHLVLSDVVMPGLSGRELVEILVRTYPEIKYGFLSGYTADAVLRHGIEEERVPFLQKPYTLEDLTEFARAILDAP